MKFLCDVNISKRTTRLLNQLTDEAKHVNDVFESSEVRDLEIIKYADANGYAIISHDEDFYKDFLSLNRPEKLISLKTRNIIDSQLGFLFEKNIEDFISVLSL